MSGNFTKDDLGKLGLIETSPGVFQKKPQEIKEVLKTIHENGVIPYNANADKKPITYEGVLMIEPQSAARARVFTDNRTGKIRAASTPKYYGYKNTLIKMIKEEHLHKMPKVKWGVLHCEFQFPFPKGIPQYKRVEGMPKITKPDWDNLVKAIQDALEHSGAMKNDSKIHTGSGKKTYTFGQPRIIFKLSTS